MVSYIVRCWNSKLVFVYLQFWSIVLQLNLCAMPGMHILGEINHRFVEVKHVFYFGTCLYITSSMSSDYYFTASLWYPFV